MLLLLASDRRCGAVAAPAYGREVSRERESARAASCSIVLWISFHISLRPHAEDEVLHTWPHPGRPIGCCASLATLRRAKD